MKLLTIFLLLLSFNSNASYCLLELTNGNLRIDSTSIETCPSGMILLSKDEYDLSFTANVITALDIAESFTWGFGTYIGFWFLGYAIKNARMVIRKA
ncbi:MAG: hypothetical protein QNK36_03930 [Colwellia sp.]|nr:hypothetical protein [Colwellia sp.]